jgi:hypothetical protein
VARRRVSLAPVPCSQRLGGAPSCRPTVARAIGQTGLGGLVGELLLTFVLAITNGSGAWASAAIAVRCSEASPRERAPGRARFRTGTGCSTTAIPNRLVSVRTLWQCVFRDLLIGQGVSGLGDWMVTVGFIASPADRVAHRVGGC